MSETQHLTTSDITKLELESLPVFKDLSLENLENLLSVCTLKRFQPGEMIIKTGSKDPWFYILLSGKVSVVVEETEVTVIHHKGALFGEAALIEDASRKADILAQTTAECLSIDTVLMQEVLCTTNMIFYAHFYKHITEMLSNRLSASNEELSLVKRAFQHIVVATAR